MIVLLMKSGFYKTLWFQELGKTQTNTPHPPSQILKSMKKKERILQLGEELKN